MHTPKYLLNTWKFYNSFHQGSVGTYIRRCEQYMAHIVGNLFRCRSLCQKHRNRL